ELDALVGERFRFVTRRLAADGPRGYFLVMDLARFFREAAADVLGIPHHFAQLHERLGGKPDGGIGGGVAFLRRLGRWCIVARSTLGDGHACGGEPLDVRVVADRARDKCALLLARELLARGEPALETVSVPTGQLENDHVW